MAQQKRTNMLPGHQRVLAQLEKDPDYKLTRKDLREVEREYRWHAPGVSDDPSMIDFFDTPRPTLFDGVIRVWNCAYMSAQYSGVLSENGKHAKIVDIGAGRGESFRVLGSQRLAKGARVDYTAVDIDVRKRELFNAMYPNDRQKYKTHDVRQGLPFEDASVDCFMCTETIEHVTRQEGIELLAEIMRCLKPGGHFVCTTPNATMKTTAESVYHAHEWEDDDFRQQIEAAGFEVVEWYYGGVTLRTLGDLVPPGASRRICTDLVRSTLGRASGLPGNIIECVVRRPLCNS